MNVIILLLYCRLSNIRRYATKEV